MPAPTDRTYYAPGAGDADTFHILRNPEDIRGVCGTMVDNSGDNLRDRRPNRNVHSRCDDIIKRESEADAE